MFIADSGHERVLEVPAGGGTQITVANGLHFPTAVTGLLTTPAFSAETPLGSNTSNARWLR